MDIHSYQNGFEYSIILIFFHNFYLYNFGFIIKLRQTKFVKSKVLKEKKIWNINWPIFLRRDQKHIRSNKRAPILVSNSNQNYLIHMMTQIHQVCSKRAIRSRVRLCMHAWLKGMWKSYKKANGFVVFLGYAISLQLEYFNCLNSRIIHQQHYNKL